jgi:hypothetical protein
MNSESAFLLTKIIMKTVIFIICFYYLDSQLYVDKSVNDFLFYTHMAESVLSIRNLNSESITDGTILNFLQFYITSILLWLFILWSFGCDFNKSTIVQNTIFASYLIMVLTKNRDWCSNIGIDLYKNNCIEYNKNDQNNNTDNENTNRNTKLTRKNISIFNINQYKPTISYTLLMVFVISAVYLLDWEEKWQNWPVPTIFGAFIGSIIDELLVLG